MKLIHILPVCIAVLLIRETESRELSLSHGWTIRNSNGSECIHWYISNKHVEYWFYSLDEIGIFLGNQKIPSGIYSALQEASITESVLHSYNDVNLRWIAGDNWTYSLAFQGKVQLDLCLRNKEASIRLNILQLLHSAGWQRCIPVSLLGISRYRHHRRGHIEWTQTGTKPQ